MGINLNMTPAATGWKKAHVKAAYERLSKNGKPGFNVEFFINESGDVKYRWFGQNTFGLADLKTLCIACGLKESQLTNFDPSMLIQRECMVKLEMEGKYINVADFRELPESKDDTSPDTSEEAPF